MTDAPASSSTPSAPATPALAGHFALVTGGGSGIGLAVVDEIVTALDGSVDIQSEVGRGTTVTVRLPLYKKPAASGAPQPRSGGPAGR